MKVKVGEFKAHLSKYLRQLRESKEPIEVCMREEPVAYLTAAKDPELSDGEKRAELQRDLAEAGLALTRHGLPDGGPTGFLPRPVRAGDTRTDLETVRRMREEKPY
ncbi:MAG: hypothetical protein R6V45_02890 [Oceanipulchritudo sp.]